MEKENSVFKKILIIYIDNKEYQVPILVNIKDNFTSTDQDNKNVLTKNQFLTLSLLNLEFSLQSYQFESNLNIEKFLTNLFFENNDVLINEFYKESLYLLEILIIFEDYIYIKDLLKFINNNFDKFLSYSMNNPFEIMMKILNLIVSNYKKFVTIDKDSKSSLISTISMIIVFHHNLNEYPFNLFLMIDDDIKFEVIKSSIKHYIDKLELKNNEYFTTDKLIELSLVLKNVCSDINIPEKMDELKDFYILIFGNYKENKEFEKTQLSLLDTVHCFDKPEFSDIKKYEMEILAYRKEICNLKMELNDCYQETLMENKSNSDLVKSWIIGNKKLKLSFSKLYDTNFNDCKINIGHQKFCNKGKTLHIIKSVTNHNIIRIFGGFTNVDIELNSGYKTDESSFIFSMTDKKKFPILSSKDSKALHFSNSNFICFGYHSLVIKEDCCKNFNSYSNPSNEICYDYLLDIKNVDKYLAGDMYFKVIQYQVFQVLEKYY